MIVPEPLLHTPRLCILRAVIIVVVRGSENTVSNTVILEMILEVISTAASAVGVIPTLNEHLGPPDLAEKELVTSTARERHQASRPAVPSRLLIVIIVITIVRHTTRSIALKAAVEVR